MRSGAQSQGEKSFNRDKDTPIPASPIHHQNEDITPELETTERNNKVIRLQRSGIDTIKYHT